MQESHQHMVFVVMGGLKETVLATLPMKCNCFSELTQLFSEGICIVSWYGECDSTIGTAISNKRDAGVRLDGCGGRSKTGSIED